MVSLVRHLPIKTGRPRRTHRSRPKFAALGVPWCSDGHPLTPQDAELLAAAQRGDEDAFGRLTDPFRGELHAHCYRMLGSVHDAEDALQEVFLRAWRGLARFEGRSSLRSWLYTIATNTCLNQIARRPKRVLPLDYGPSRDAARTGWASR